MRRFSYVRVNTCNITIRRRWVLMRIVHCLTIKITGNKTTTKQFRCISYERDLQEQHTVQPRYTTSPVAHIHPVSDDDTSIGGSSVSGVSSSTSGGAATATTGSVSSLAPAAVRERRASYRDNVSVTSRQQQAASRRRTMSEMSDGSCLSYDSSTFDAASIIGKIIDNSYLRIVIHTVRVNQPIPF